MSELDPAKQAFITAELESFRDYLLDRARASIIRRNIKVDETLLNSLAVEALSNEILMKFSDHGRMHDMGAGNGYRKGKFMGDEDRVAFLKGRRPSKWYSRLAWGSVYGTLVNNLANKYVAEVPGSLVKEFNKD